MFFVLVYCCVAINLEGPVVPTLRTRGPLAALAVATALIAAGCGSSSSDDEASSATKAVPGTATNASTAAPAAKSAAIEIKVSAPADGATVRTSKVQVRGVVTPTDAVVHVAGKKARVEDGLFEASASLARGENSIDVVATADGADPQTTTLSVKRGRSAAELARARKAKAARAARAAARRKARAAARAAKANAAVSVPDVVGERLDVAKDDLQSAGFRTAEIGGGTFGIVVESNWTVCETRPAGGSQVKKHARIKLIVDRAC
jgi:hypothetical protein